MSDLFKEKAEVWDVDETIKKLSSAVGSEIVKRVSLHESMTVMDFGAGTGLITSHVAPLVKKIIAVDTSEAMLKKLEAKPELKGKVEVVCQDIIEHPLGVAYDLIISAMAIHHVKDTGKLIQRFAEHSEPGAVIALADLDKEDGRFHPEDTEGVFHCGFERDAFREILENAGFIDVQFSTAHSISRNGKEYTIFLVVAVKAG